MTSLVILCIIISITGVSAIDVDNSTTNSIEVENHHDSQVIESKEVNNDFKEISTKSVKKSVNTDTNKINTIKNNPSKTININKSVKSTNTTSEERESNNTSVGDSGTDNENSTSNQTNPTKIDPEITVNTTTIVPGNTSVFVANLPDDATGKAVFKLNGKTISEELNVTGGTVTYEYLVPSDLYCYNYILTFVYSGNSKYLETRLNTSLISGAEKIDPTIDVTATPIVPGNASTIVANLPSDATGKVVFKLNDMTISDVIVVNNGSVTYEYLVPSDLYCNNYVLTTVYTGNVKYLTKRLNTNLTSGIVKVEPDIRVSVEPIAPGNVSRFVALLPSDATGKVVFKLNGKTISDEIKVNGSLVSYDYLVPNDCYYESYNVTLVYSGNSKYLSKRLNTTADIGFETGLTPNITSNNFTLKYLSTGKITANLPTDATGYVIFTLNRTSSSGSSKVANSTASSGQIKIDNGIATYYYNATLLPGRYRLIVYYEGNIHYTNGTVREYVTINKLHANAVVSNASSKAGATSTFRAYITDETNKAVNGTNVVFKINGITIGRNMTNEKGAAYLTYTLPSNYNSKNYTLSIISNSTSTVTFATNTSTLTMGQLKTSVKIPTVNCKINDTVSLSATVIDYYKNNVLKGTVTFLLNGKTLTKVNVSNGYALYSFKPNTNVATKMNITAIFNGNWKYASSNNTKGVINVAKVGTVTTTRYAETQTGQSVVLSAMVKDKNQKNVNGGTVVFKVNGKEVGTAVVKNGAANYTYDIGLLKKGAYRLNATYLGSDSYYSSYNLNYLNITALGARIVASPVYVKVGQSTTITVSVLDQSNYNVESGTISFKINGTVIGKATVKKGVATLKYTPPYKYSGLTLRYVATLENNTLYNSTSTIQNITISPLNDVYVSKNGSDNNLGDSKHPFKTLTYAIGHVATFGKVHVATGTYYASGILINNTVSIIGQGTYKTYISSDGSYNPIFKVTAYNTLVNINGLTIKNGKSNTIRSAGAIVSLGKLNITGVNFINNKATGNLSGGAIYTSGIVNLTNVQFIRNSVSNPNAEGGAIRAINNTTTIKNVKFINNTATGSNSTGGGAIYLKDGDLIIRSSQFTGNKASSKTSLGGAIKSSYGDMVIVSTTFKNNYAYGSDYSMGGAISSLATGLYINNSLIESNHAEGSSYGAGGAVYAQYAAVVIGNSTIKNNYAKAKTTAYGGAINGYYIFAEISKTTFSANSANSTGSQSFGGAIYQEKGNLTLTKTEFKNNVISAKTAIAGALYSYANATITNSNFTSNKIKGTNVGGGAIANLGNMTVTKSNFVSNNASLIGDAMTATTSAKTTINGNYWGSSSPTWSYVLRGITKPSSYSKTKLKN